MSANRKNSIARMKQRKFDFLGHSAPARETRTLITQEFSNGIFYVNTFLKGI